MFQRNYIFCLPVNMSKNSTLVCDAFDIQRNSNFICITQLNVCTLYLFILTGKFLETVSFDNKRGNESTLLDETTKFEVLPRLTSARTGSIKIILRKVQRHFSNDEECFYYGLQHSSSIFN